MTIPLRPWRDYIQLPNVYLMSLCVLFWFPHFLWDLRGCVTDPKGVWFVDLWITIDHQLAQSWMPTLTFPVLNGVCLRDWGCDRSSPFPLRVYCTRDSLSGLKLRTLFNTWMMLWQRCHSKQWFRHEITQQACLSTAYIRPLALWTCRTTMKPCSVKLCIKQGCSHPPDAIYGRECLIFLCFLCISLWFIHCWCVPGSVSTRRMTVYHSLWSESSQILECLVHSAEGVMNEL